MTRTPVYTNGVSGDQARFVSAAVFSSPWGRFFDQGERVFEIVLLVLWLAFVLFLAVYAVCFIRENAKKSPRRKRRRDRPPSAVRAVADRWQAVYGVLERFNFHKQPPSPLNFALCVDFSANEELVIIAFP